MERRLSFTYPTSEEGQDEWRYAWLFSLGFAQARAREGGDKRVGNIDSGY